MTEFRVATCNDLSGLTLEIKEGMLTLTQNGVPLSSVPLSGLTPPVKKCLRLCPSGIQHPGEKVSGNPQFVAIGDGYYYMADNDGSMSVYSVYTRTQVLDYAWTALSGGPLNGAKASEIRSSPSFMGIENGYIYVVAPDGSIAFYLAATGQYLAADAYVTTTLTGGPMAGFPLKNAVGNSYPRFKWLGVGVANLVWYDIQDKKLVTYSPYNGLYHLPAASAATLSGGSFAGPIGDAIDSGRLVGLNGYGICFMAPSGALQAYNIWTGTSYWDYAGEPLLPYCKEYTCTGDSCANNFDAADRKTLAQLIAAGAIEFVCGQETPTPAPLPPAPSLPAPVVECFLVIDPSQPHGAEDVLGNPQLIDFSDNLWYFVDDDGSVSAYSALGRTLAANYTYKTLSGGGPHNGKAIESLKADPQFFCIENGLYVLLNPADGSLCFYSAATGLYLGADAYTATALVGGPMAGISLANAIAGTNPRFQRMGGLTLHMLWYDTQTKRPCAYLYSNLTYDSVWSLTGGSLTGGAFAGTIDAAMTSGRFVGVEDAEISFMAPNGNLLAYNASNGILVWDQPGQPLLPAATKWTCNDNACTATGQAAKTKTEIVGLGAKPVKC